MLVTFDSNIPSCIASSEYLPAEFEAIFIDFEVDSTKKIDIQVHIDSEPLFSLSTNGNTVTLEDGRFFTWEELSSVFNPTKSCSLTWPYFVVEKHLYPLSYGLISDESILLSKLKYLKVKVVSNGNELDIPMTLDSHEKNVTYFSIRNRSFNRQYAVQSNEEHPYLILSRFIQEESILEECIYTEPDTALLNSKEYPYMKVLKYTTEDYGIITSRLITVEAVSSGNHSNTSDDF